MGEEEDEEHEIVVDPKVNWREQTKSVRLDKILAKGEDDKPTWEVESWVSVCILEVDTQKSQFKCDLELEMVYFDESLLQFKEEIPYEGSVSLTERQRKQYGIEETKPRVMLENCDDPQLTYFNLEADFQTGRVYIQYNWMAVYREVLELERFPFDRQLLRIYIEISDVKPLAPEQWSKDNDELPFQVTEVLQDFDYAGYSARWKESMDPAFETQCHISVEVQRRPTFYLFNFMFITFLVVLLNSASISLGIDSQERLAYSANLVLTLVAFKFVIVQNAPVISYMTLLDRYNFFAFVVLFLGVMQHAAVSPRAALLFGVTESDMSIADVVIQMILLAVWLLSHLMISVLIICGGFYKSWDSVYAENFEGTLSRANRSHKQQRRITAQKTFWERANRTLV